MIPYMQGDTMKHVVHLMMITIIVLSAQWGYAEKGPFVGHWLGTLKFAGGQLRIVFHIACSAPTECTGTLDSPDQGVSGIPISQIQIQNNTIRIDVEKIMGVFEGELSSDKNMLKGVWKQSGFELPLELKRTDNPPGVVELKRPQEPKPPFPYTVEKVTFPAGEKGITLAGTLTLPEGKGPFPALILVSGSGPQDRNETIAGHKPFLVLSDALTRIGWAVLRYDDRGVGESTGDFALATTLDFAKDAESAFEFLKKRKDILPDRIGLLGHSEGAILVSLVASRHEDVAFLVLISPPALRGDLVILHQTERITRLTGVPEDFIKESQTFQKNMFQIIRTEKNEELMRQKLEQTIREYYAHFSEEQQKEYGLNEANIPVIIQQFTSPWFRFFIDFDPFETYTKVRCPVLVLFGERDLQVPPDLHAPRIIQAFEQGKLSAYTLVKFPGLNHLMQTSETGLPSEYVQIEETFSQKALRMLIHWLTLFPST